MDSAFTQDLSKWDTSSVTNASNFIELPTDNAELIAASLKLPPRIYELMNDS